MDITIHASFLPHTDPDASLAFYRDALGFEVRGDVGHQGMRWITVGPAGQPETSIVLHPPGVAPGITDDERRTIVELMAKGSYFGVNLPATTSTRRSRRSRPAARRSCRSPPTSPTGSATARSATLPGTCSASSSGADPKRRSFVRNGGDLRTGTVRSEAGTKERVDGRRPLWGAARASSSAPAA